MEILQLPNHKFRAFVGGDSANARFFLMGHLGLCGLIGELLPIYDRSTVALSGIFLGFLPNVRAKWINTMWYTLAGYSFTIYY